MKNIISFLTLMAGLSSFIEVYANAAAGVVGTLGVFLYLWWLEAPYVWWYFIILAGFLFVFGILCDVYTIIPKKVRNLKVIGSVIIVNIFEAIIIPIIAILLMEILYMFIPNLVGLFIYPLTFVAWIMCDTFVQYIVYRKYRIRNSIFLLIIMNIVCTLFALISFIVVFAYIGDGRERIVAYKNRTQEIVHE